MPYPTRPIEISELVDSIGYCDQGGDAILITGFRQLAHALLNMRRRVGAMLLHHLSRAGSQLAIGDHL